MKIKKIKIKKKNSNHKNIQEKINAMNSKPPKPLSKIMLIGKKKKIEKINMEGLKPRYIMLSNHMHFVDFVLCNLLNVFYKTQD